MSTRSLAVREPLPEIPKLDGGIGRNANSLRSVDVVQGVQLQNTTLMREVALAFQALSIWTTEAWSGTGALCIPEDIKYLQLRRLVCAHYGEAGHRGKDTTMDSLRPARYWTRREMDVGSFINDCLNCVDSRGRGKVPRPFGETTHGTEVNSCLHFVYINIGNGVEKPQQVVEIRLNAESAVGGRQSDEQGTRAGGNPGG